MSNENQTPTMKPNQTYSWSPEDKIEISGIEYSIIQKTLAMFEPALSVSQAIFNRMLESGIAKEQGSLEVATETVQEESVVNPS